ncbi:MAG TPA: carboxypeptidase-like regulatory domain-containing protein, partial [Chitinophagaceae bacterium]|nr:carboxypeptidase-like regulatory domain-containing protein [Chitinophagaceae bacterium]
MPLCGNICHRIILTIFIIFFAHPIIAQTITGQVIEPGGKPLPFATIKFGNTKEGVVANLDGKFSIKKDVKFIEVSHTNYIARQVEILAGKLELVIILQPSTVSLQPVVVVKTSGNKLRRILNTAIANRSINNPDKYNWYQCNVYYKMIVDFMMPDSVFVKDTSRKGERIKETMKDKYFMIAETYSKRTWQKPAK